MIHFDVSCGNTKKERSWRYSPLKPDKGNNIKNMVGLITIILWALVGTMLLKSCTSPYASANEV